MWLGFYVSRWPLSMQPPCCAAGATGGYEERITCKNQTAHQSVAETRRCHWLRGSMSWITESPCTYSHLKAWTHTTCKGAHRRTKNLRYQWLRGSIVMVRRSQSSQWAKALQSPVREYIKVIFVVSQELVYQRGDCFIFAEACVHVSVSECAHAAHALLPECVYVRLFPQTPRA